MEKHFFMDTILRWSPVDRSKWYYVTTSNEVREQVPCAVFLTSDDPITNGSSAIFALDLHYSITFEGATNQLVQLAEPRDEVFVNLPPTPSGQPVRPLLNSTPRR
jgi:hypothetical protein